MIAIRAAGSEANQKSVEAKCGIHESVTPRMARIVTGATSGSLKRFAASE
jgi:hypothetical protein